MRQLCNNFATKLIHCWYRVDTRLEQNVSTRYQFWTNCVSNFVRKFEHICHKDCARFIRCLIKVYSRLIQTLYPTLYERWYTVDTKVIQSWYKFGSNCINFVFSFVNKLIKSWHKVVKKLIWSWREVDNDGTTCVNFLSTLEQLYYLCLKVDTKLI